MSESLKAIENACAQINKVTAPQHWRAPHLLQASLNTLRDSISTAHDALGMFVDTTGRISIDRKNPKSEELDNHLKPLFEAQTHLTHLRKNLDAAGWTVSDRQLVRFYAPQLDQHTESLSLAIEDFLGTVENNLPPREFVQKGKLIILAAHKLIYIGDTVSQCVGDRAASHSLRQCADRLCELLKECVRATKLASDEGAKLIYIGDTVSQCVGDRAASHSLRQCADRLCELLKECVRATKLASDEYPELKSMQGMIDSIIAVSKTAHEMKVLVKQWC
ncbi:hypothetical protein GCK32_011211 [Trichostrongylus colubriformis]|uniref:CAS family C-terminal domain-containing protein n=1 Tax=Trichostrongylus colubriformis TaxID=6319 RepID=A0AAN8FJF4_TRICO